jgi:hypothetical protein
MMCCAAAAAMELLVEVSACGLMAVCTVFASALRRVLAGTAIGAPTTVCL